MTASAPVTTDPEGKVDENSIPKSRVDVMIAKATAEASARATAAEARAELETERRKDLETRSQPAATPPSTPPVRVLSREELQAGVDAGTITQPQMDAELEQQMETRLEHKAESKQDIKDRSEKIGDQVDEYVARVPDIEDPTSDNHKRIRAEVIALHKLGYAKDVTTELVALRNVIGPLDKVKIPEEGPEHREVDSTTHGAGAGDEGGEPETAGAGPLKGLKPHFVEYYTDGIKEGRYAGWDDPHLVEIQKREIARK